MYVFFHTLCII